MMDESSQQIASVILRSSKKKKNLCKYLLQFPSGNLLQTKLYFKEKAVLRKCASEIASDNIL